MGKKILVTEGELRSLISEAVKKTLVEFYGTFDDTTSAPWNKTYDGVTNDYVDYRDDCFLDLSEFIYKYPKLKKLLSPMIDNPEDGWFYCNIGPVEIHYDVEESDFDIDEDGYVFPNNREVIEDSIEVWMDRKKNKYAKVLPDKLIHMLERLATDDFIENFSRGDLV